MYKLVLEKAEEPKIKLPTFVGSYRKQGNSRKTSTCLTCLLRNLYAGQEATIKARHGTMDWFQIRRGEIMETVTDFILFASKITADGDCSHEIKRHLFLGRKAMTNLDSMLKSREKAEE